MESAPGLLRGLGYAAWMFVLVVVIVYAGAVFVAVAANGIEDDRAPALLIALAVLAAVAAVAALAAVIKRLRGSLDPGMFVVGSLLTCASLASTLLLIVVGYAATGRT
jgi:drug/metabolite transporter (DMT)-like permease